MDIPLGGMMQQNDRNAYHAASVWADNRSKTSHKNFKILELHEHIWNHHGKCIQISPNMPDIGSLIREIDDNISEILESEMAFFCSVKL